MKDGVVTKLSWLAKEVIKECNQDPGNNIYKTYDQVAKLFPRSHYTFEQVTKYLRKIRKDQEKENVMMSLLEASEK